jgi:arsenate reductase (thioredoxin)
MIHKDTPMHRLASILPITIGSLVLGCAAPPPAQAPEAQALFVCEHGNVKSLMAASYFNELARERGLPFRAISRGSAPDSDTVPDAIRARLGAEGFDVTGYRPVALGSADLASSAHIIAISTTLPASFTVPDERVEEWQDVPPASSDYAAASSRLRQRVRELLERMAQ